MRYGFISRDHGGGVGDGDGVLVLAAAAAVVVRTERTRSTYIGESFRDCRLGVREPKANTCIIPHHRYSNTDAASVRARCSADRGEVYQYQFVLLTTIKYTDTLSFSLSLSLSFCLSVSPSARSAARATPIARRCGQFIVSFRRVSETASGKWQDARRDNEMTARYEQYICGWTLGSRRYAKRARYLDHAY